MAILVGILAFPFVAQATTKSWTNTSLTSLAHGTDYLWKVDQGGWFIPEGETIVSAYLDITALNNWREPDPDYMNIYLLNNPYYGWPTKTLLDTFRDENWYRSNGTYINPAENYHYDLTLEQIALLTDYLNDARFGIGFDPNCHYSDTDMIFTIVTDKVPTVPEPATLLLMGLGLLSIAGLKVRIKS
jgi:hypothetical protein